MKINVLATKIDAKNNIVAGSKNIRLTIPSKEINVFGKSWAELHRITFSLLIKDYTSLVKNKLVNNNNFLTRKKEYRYCSFDPKNIYKENYKRYNKITNDFYIFNSYVNFESLRYLKNALLALFPDINDLFIEFDLDKKVTKDNDERFEFRYSFKKYLNQRSSSKFGTSEISLNKLESGKKVEKYVFKHLNDKNIVSKDVSEHEEYPFDLLIDNIGVEIKNISNNLFYISNNEIIAYQNNNCLICFVDLNNNKIFLSKKYYETIVLKKLIEQQREIDALIIDKYNGIFKATDIAIAITKEISNGLSNDFIRIDNKNKNKIETLLN